MPVSTTPERRGPKTSAARGSLDAVGAWADAQRSNDARMTVDDRRVEQLKALIARVAGQAAQARRR
jgi:hypothetical protein